jgi:hypothetical protein
MLTRPLYETYPDLYPREVQRLMVCANMLNSANAINKAWSAFTSKYGNGSRAEYHVNRQQLWHGAGCRQLIAMRGHRLSVTFDSNIGSFGSSGPVGLHLHLLFHVFGLSKVVARDTSIHMRTLLQQHRARCAHDTRRSSDDSQPYTSH